MLSYAARINYSLLGRYLFSATMRWDGASQLYNQWDSFPSASIGWRISDEPWMEPTADWLDNLKLRAGYGVTGNSNIAAYSSKTLVETSANSLNLGGGQVQSYILTQAVANYDLGWEKPTTSTSVLTSQSSRVVLMPASTTIAPTPRTCSTSANCPLPTAFTMPRTPTR